LDWRIPTGS